MFRFQTLVKGPDLNVLPGSVTPVENLPPILLNFNAELSFKTIGRFVATKYQVFARLLDVRLNGCHRIVRLLRSSEKTLSTQERIGEGGRIVIFAPLFGFPSVDSARLKFLSFEVEVSIRSRLNRVIATVSLRGCGKKTSQDE